ncbi:MAG: cytidylate kinase [Syntrophaceae bacterium PtaU1.Bin231]|nr:MAG: cytidylate kinase [Syntrophaceae bacterium PtaU1.Bin231]
MMPSQSSLENTIEEQIRRWEIEKRKKYKNPIRPVITLSRLPGALGGDLARKLAHDLNLDLFDQEIVERISADDTVGRQIVESLDEQDRSVFDEWISALGEDHRSSYEYLQRLTNVVAAIGTHGYAVIVGRGAGFILPKEVSLRVLVTAPLGTRIRNVMRRYGAAEAEAARQIMRTESERKAFIRKYFHADLTDPVNYDLVVNTENIDVDLAAATIKEIFNSRRWYAYSPQ